MQWKKVIRDYFSFSRRERLGLVTLTILIVCVFLLPTVIDNNRRLQNVVADRGWMVALTQIETDSATAGPARKNAGSLPARYPVSGEANTPSLSLFYFDPNTTDAMGWQRLGIREKTARTILNFLSKGGHFYKPDDLKKIYGLRHGDIERLLPYVRIREAGDEMAPARPQDGRTRENFHGSPKFTAIDINIADTAAFIALPGIGSKLAARIVTFREKLGGFYSITQVKETFGLHDSVYQRILPFLKLANPVLKTININTASVDELKVHPYFRYNLAKAIVSYRSEHGPFGKVEELSRVMAVTEDLLKKLSPYLVVR